jgi:hypothetical protein
MGENGTFWGEWRVNEGFFTMKMGFYYENVFFLIGRWVF